MSIGGDELRLYADNDFPLYQRKMAWFKNFAVKKARGNFVRLRAIDALAKYLAKEAAAKYAKEFGSTDDPTGKKMFPMTDRVEAAMEWINEFESEYRDGNFDALLPKKYQKARAKERLAKQLQDASLVSGNPHEVQVCPVGMQVQTLLFPGDWPVAKAKAWAKQHDFKVTKFERAGEHVRSRQRPPSHFRPDSFRTIALGDGGVKAVVGCPK